MYIKWMDKDAPRFTESLPYHSFIHSFNRYVLSTYCMPYILEVLET